MRPETDGMRMAKDSGEDEKDAEGDGPVDGFGDETERVRVRCSHVSSRIRRMWARGWAEDSIVVVRVNDVVIC